MNVLIILNGEIIKRDNGLFVLNGEGEFLLELASLGHNLEVIHFCFLYKSKNSIAGCSISNNDNIKVTCLKHRKNKYLSYIFAYLRIANSILQNDFIYFFYPSSFFFVGFLTKLFGKKFGLCIRGEVGIYSKTSKLLYNYSKISLTVSPKFTKFVQSCGGNSDTIRPMIDYSESDMVVDRVYRDKKRYNILFISRVEQEKGVFELIEAINRLNDDGINNFKLKIIGEGGAWTKVNHRCEKYGLHEVVNLHGKVVDKTDLSNFYKSADLFILPSYNEGFPRVLYEAMIFGVPIITTFVGAIDGVMKDGYNCYKIESKDVDTIYNILKLFLLNYKEKSIVAKNASSTIAEYLHRFKMSHAQLLNENMESAILNKC
jgi:glycosyltransferase involved in cell wall biosynthesis